MPLVDPGVDVGHQGRVERVVRSRESTEYIEPIRKEEGLGVAARALVKGRLRCLAILEPCFDDPALAVGISPGPRQPLLLSECQKLGITRECVPEGHEVSPST